MKLLVIILSVVLFSGIYGLNTDELGGIDVLATLKSKNLSCDLHDFVKSTDKSDDEYKSLTDDLMKYCSKSESTKQYHLICHMILIELEIGCSLSNKSRALPIKYIGTYTPTQICSIPRITQTNSWIRKKLSLNEKDQMGLTSTNLCSTLTSLNETLGLVRFFYKIAPRIRRADLSNETSVLHKTLPDEIQPSKDKTNNTREKVLDLKKDINVAENQEPVESVIRKAKNRRNKRRNEHLSEDEDNKPQNNDKRNIIDSGPFKNLLKIRRKQVDPENLKQADSKKADDVDIKPAAEAKKNEDGLPLGRAGERPEREQVNERQKPKALDNNSVYKANEREERNWIGGKGIEGQREKIISSKNNRRRRTKLEENPSIIGEAPKKRPSLRSKLNRYKDNNDEWSRKFITIALVFTLVIVIAYLILQMKNKVLGFLIEGCRRQRSMPGRRLGMTTSSSRHHHLSQSS